MALQVSSIACTQNHKCPLIRVCPVNAITQNGMGLPAIDEFKCIECGKCVRYCPMQAVHQKPSGVSQ